MFGPNRNIILRCLLALQHLRYLIQMYSVILFHGKNAAMTLFLDINASEWSPVHHSTNVSQIIYQETYHVYFCHCLEMRIWTCLLNP